MSDALTAWKSYVTVEKGLAPETVRAYEREIQLLPEPREELTPDDLRAVLHAQEGKKPATIARMEAAWSSFYRFLVRTDRRLDDPTMKLDRPKVGRGLPRPVEDVDATLAKLDPTARAIAVFLLETGLRISEACSVSVQAIPHELRVLGKGNKERAVVLTDAARAALGDLGGSIPWTPRRIQATFRKAGFTPHQCRHTLATRLANDDVDISVIQDILGHRSPETTRVYQRNNTARLRRALERDSA